MTPRERELAAIRHQVPDRIPADAICLENSGEVADYLGIEPDAVPERLGIDGCIAAPAYTGELRRGPDGAVLNEWGTPCALDYGTARWYPFSMDTSIRDIERYPWPDPADYDYAGTAQMAVELGCTYAVRGPYWRPLFCRVCDLFGMEEVMVRMLAASAALEAALERILAFNVEHCERFLDACGDAVPILCLGDDFATQRGLMISPKLWRRWLKPGLAELFAVGKQRGKIVWFHSCGDVTAVLPDLIAIGVDVWETVQLHTLPLSPQALKREYGTHLTFFGGVSTQRLPFATPEEVQEETLRCIEALGEGGGYICGPDHHIKPDVPAPCAVALFDAITSFQREGYTRHAAHDRF